MNRLGDLLHAFHFIINLQNIPNFFAENIQGMLCLNKDIVVQNHHKFVENKNLREGFVEKLVGDVDFRDTFALVVNCG